MADSGTSDGAGSSDGQQQTQQGRGIFAHMMSNKVEAGLWLTRLCTVFFSLFFLFPIIGGSPYSFYQRALISSAATSALRLHQRVPNIQFTRQFLGQIFLEDSCHYLMFSLIFVNTYPITMALVPVFLFALLHACSYTKVLLNIMGPQSLQIIRNLVAKLEAQQVNILRFIACNEIFLMPAVIFMMISGKASIFLPFIFYRFLNLRYTSRRNPYCRTLFTELKMTVEFLCNKPQCPQMLRNLCYKGIGLISRLAPAVPS